MTETAVRRGEPAFGPLSAAGFFAGVAAIYSLLPVTSGLSVEISVLDVVAAAGFWALLGGLGGYLAQRFAPGFLRDRTAFAWTLAVAAWAIIEAAFTAIVVVKPTRWPPLAYSVLGIGLPAAIAAGVALWALRRAARGAGGERVHPALVVLTSWALLAALLLWLPRWLRALGDAPGLGWILWGLLDLVWIVSAVGAVVLIAMAVFARRRRHMALAGAVALVALQLVPVAIHSPPSAPAPARPGPPVVWIMIDSVRADHVSGYGYHRPTMPNLDRLATEGTLVKSHISTGTRTENTYVKMLSLADSLDRFQPARPVPLSGVRMLLPASVTQTQPGLVGSMRAQGYQTALFHVYHDLLEDRGLQPWLQGFDAVSRTRLSGDASLGAYVTRMVFGDRLDGRPRMDRWAAHRRKYLAEDVTSQVQGFLESRDAAQPLFMIVHLAGGHFPYYSFGKRVLPDPQPAGVARTYDDSLRAADVQLGTIVELVRAKLPGAVVFVFSDHGIQLPNEPRLPQHIHVPLVVTPPLGTEPTAITSSLDIVATTLAMARGEAASCQSSLARDLRCPAPEAIRVVDHTGHGDLMFAALLDGQLVGLDIRKSKVTIGSHGKEPISECEFLAKTKLGVADMRVSPLETRDALPERLRAQLQRCASRPRE